MNFLFLNLITSFELNKRIYNGTLVPTPYSFFGAMFDKGNKDPQCGSILIKPNIALTAAHCVYQKTYDYILFNTIDSINGIKSTIDYVIIRHDFDVHNEIRDSKLFILKF